jgi:WAS/WASL-interacting protein
MDAEDTPPVEGRLLNQISRITKETEMIHMSRKTAVTSFLVICAMAIAAMPAFAAGGVAFQASSLPVQVRGEGLTETIGAVVLQATSNGTVVSGSSITVVYSGAITNSSAFSGQNGLSCNSATACPAGVPTTITVSASGNAATIAFTAPLVFAVGDYIELSQVRMNVNGLGSGTSTVTATLSGTSGNPINNPITFTQSQVGVASIVNPSVAGSIPSGGGASAIQTCAVPSSNTFKVKVAENYPAALTSLTDESSFTPITTISNGSLVNVVISNVPSGLAVNYNSFSAAPTGSTITPTISSSTAAYQVSTGSAMTYTFAITGDSTSLTENFTLSFGVGLPNSSNAGLSTSAGTLPAIGTIVNATATVSLAPASGIVSFATNNEGGGTVATISDCVTNILFPFVTNQLGYDTSYSIANTTSNALAFGAGAGASVQSGSCTLSLWPTTDTTLAAATPLGTASQYTTPTIPSGSVYAFSQSATSFSGQTGYVIAVCRFLNAHGFAFLTNGFAQSAGPQLSHGYLGLVMPNPIAGRSNSNGESLVQ